MKEIKNIFIYENLFDKHRKNGNKIFFYCKIVDYIIKHYIQKVVYYDTVQRNYILNRRLDKYNILNENYSVFNRNIIFYIYIKVKNFYEEKENINILLEEKIKIHDIIKIVNSFNHNRYDILNCIDDILSNSVINNNGIKIYKRIKIIGILLLQLKHLETNYKIADKDINYYFKELNILSSYFYCSDKYFLSFYVGELVNILKKTNICCLEDTMFKNQLLLIKKI